MSIFQKAHVQPNAEAEPPRSSPEVLRRCLALSLGFAASLCLPSTGYSQTSTIHPADVDAGTVQPLELKPGCWEVRMEEIGRMGVTQLEIRPEEIPQLERGMTPEQLTQFEAIVKTLQEVHKKDGNQADENQQRGVSAPNGDQRMVCTAAPFAQNGVEVYGSQTQQCERSVEESSGVRHMHILCRGPGGIPQFLADYQRINEGYFTGTRLQVQNGMASVVTFAGKWMGEASLHLPHSPPPTDLDSKRPLGPLAVASLDGFRVVAMAEGQQIAAWVAYNMFRAESARMLKEYGPNPTDEFQQGYLHWSVANEAMNMMLGVQEPWKSQLKAAGIENLTPSNVRFNIGMSEGLTGPFGPSSVGTNLTPMEQEDARERILWEAYFSQVKTEEEKQALLQKVKEKYKVTVVDPDFFSHQKSP